MTEDEIDSDSFDLAGFLDDHSELFVVMGVFAALSVYLSDSAQTTLQKAPETVQGGYVASLVITGVVGVLIYREMMREFGSFNNLVEGHFQARNIDLFVFSVMFLLLFQAILSLAVQLQAIVLQILSAIGGFLTVVITMVIFLQIERFDPSRRDFVIGSWIYSIVLVWGGAYLLNYVENKLSIVSVKGFSPSRFWEVWPNIIDSFAETAFLLGIVLLLLTIIVTSIFVVAELQDWVGDSE